MSTYTLFLGHLQADICEAPVVGSGLRYRLENVKVDVSGSRV